MLTAGQKIYLTFGYSAEIYIFLLTFFITVIVNTFFCPFFFSAGDGFVPSCRYIQNVTLFY